MKKIILLLALLFPLALSAQMTTADNAYDKGNFTEALTAYQTAAKTAQGDDLYKAQLRIIASQYMLGQYLNAAKTAFTTPLPKDPLWKARFLLYRIQTAKQVRSVYRPIQNHADEEEGDFENLSTQQWNDKINETFEALWALRAALIYAPLQQETLILDTQDTDLQAIPTLFDFVVLQWQNTLQSLAPAQPLHAADVLTKNNISNPTSYDIHKLLFILGEAIKMGGSNRADARLIWQVKRLTLPFEQERFFTFTDKAKERQQVIQKLKELSGYGANEKTGFLDKISRALLRSSKTDYGRSVAALNAAQMLNEDESFADAVALCDWAKDNLSENYYSKSCARLAADIRAPFVHLQGTAFTPNPTHAELSFSVRNVPQIYVRLYPVAEEELQKWNQAKNNSSWDYLTYISAEDIPQLLRKNPVYSSSEKIEYTKPYAQKQQTLTLPQISAPGFYAAVLSYEPDFDMQKAPVSAGIINISNLALFVTTAIEDDPLSYYPPATAPRTPAVFRIYSLNAKTGQPEAHTDISYFTDWSGTKKTGRTGENAVLSLTQKITSGKNNSYFILPRADKNDNTAILNNRVYFNFNSPAPFKLFTETDRAIYRPGQTVQIAVYGFAQAGRGLKTMPKGSAVQLTILDTNYEKVLNQTLKLNAYGTAQTSFVLPETGLLGNYRIELSYPNNRNIRAYGSFKVEEYKRPDYEITLDPAAALQYDKENRITGKAIYYFGTPVEKAEVQYTVTRRAYHPPFWWWRMAPSSETTQIAQGKTTTAKDGSFEIPFTPKTGADKTIPYQFEVKVSVLDDSGRAIDAMQNYKASEKNMFFSVAFEKGFFDANVASALAQINVLDINGQPLTGKFTAEIEQVENVYPSDEKIVQSENKLESWYGQNKVIRTVSKQQLSTSDGQSVMLQIPALPEGIYKLKLSAKNAQNAELIFLVAQEKSQLALPAVALAQQPDYFPNTQAKILIGAGQLNGPKYIEIYEAGQFLALADRRENGAEIYTLPIKTNWRGGVHLRWFGVSDYKQYTAQTFINVPFDNKELTLTMDIPSVVKPGQKNTWKIQAKNAAGTAVNAQASVRIYDKSLDYYAKPRPAFVFNDLYRKFSLAANLSDSDFNTYFVQHFTGKSDSVYLEPPQLPHLNLDMRFARYGRVYSLGATRDAAAAPRMAMMKSAAAVNTMDMAMEEKAISFAADVEADGAENTSTEDSPRTDFSETAYFNSMLPINGGIGTVAFTMPQSLTAWNIQALAFTPDVNIGSFTAQTLTQKDIMARLSLPRFWREGDQSVLVVQITNTSAQKITGEVRLDLLVDGKDAAAAFGIDKPTRTITVPAQENIALTWPVQVPQNVGMITVTATVRAGKDSDAESRQLPILPSKERLAESTTAALESGTQLLKLDNLLTPDATRRVSQVTLRVDPGLFLSVLNTMPQLLRPTYTDALSQVNRYVPLAVVNAFYTTYPVLQTAVGNLPKRNTQRPVWDNTDPARLMLLEETPWLHTSWGGATRKDFLADLFDPASVEKARTQTEKNLAKYQTASGGFSWMPGGEPSEFITLRILAAYAQILHYGGQIPQASAQKALAWLAPRIEKNLKESSASVSAVSYALYSAYVFTAYPKTWKAIQSAPVKKWLDYADRHSRYMTPLGQTYAAAAYYRLGENTKAENYLDLVLSRMKTDPVTGAYFAPEAQSWLWYNDTLTTQTATLRTLLEIRPKSDKAADLVKWLLFNRKAQVWQDTTAVAQTVYTLLDYMQRRGLVDDPAQYILQWGEQHTTLNFQPFDWSGQLSWTKEAENVAPQYYTAQVTKRGGMTGFVTLDAVYTTANAKASQPGVINVTRRYLLKYNEDGREKVRALQPDEEIPAGAEVEVELTLQASSAFDFVLLADPKPAGFENTQLTSGWTWDALSYYREIRDGQTNFFLNRVPAGTYTLRYTLRPTLAGTYQVLPAQVQSMYAPQFSAHTASDTLKIK